MTRSIIATTTVLLLSITAMVQDAGSTTASPEPTPPKTELGLQIQYLEIVTNDLDATCKTLAQLHGVTFSEPVVNFGNARTAALPGGGMLGVRAPMRDDEDPVVRPYILVHDIAAAVKAAEAAGAEIAMPPMNIPDHGSFAIYILGGIQHGLWQK